MFERKKKHVVNHQDLNGGLQSYFNIDDFRSKSPPETVMLIKEVGYVDTDKLVRFVKHKMIVETYDST